MPEESGGTLLPLFVALAQRAGTDIAKRDFALAVSGTGHEKYLIDLCGYYRQ